jgi:hypothetical protein
MQRWIYLARTEILEAQAHPSFTQVVFLLLHIFLNVILFFGFCSETILFHQGLFIGARSA